MKKSNKLKLKFTKGEASDLFKDLEEFLRKKNIENKVAKGKKDK